MVPPAATEIRSERVLVTGGTGCIGSHLVRAMVAEGCETRVLTRSAERGRTKVPPEVELVEGDVTDPDAVRRAVKGRTLIFHLAGPFREPKTSVQRYWDVQFGGTKLMLEAAEAEGVRRFVHTSTIGVLGHIADPPANEYTPYNPGDPYQESKAAAERMVLEFQRSRDFPLTIARPTSVYGPGDFRFLKLFRAIQRGRFIMLGPGEVHLHLVHLDDLVEGYRLLASRPEALGEVFIIGGPGSLNLRDLARLIADVLEVPAPRGHFPVRPIQLAGSLCEKLCKPLGIEPPIYRRRVDFFTKSRSFTTAKAEEMLGYRPKIELRDGLHETVEWYRTQGCLT